jgi:hypothetical protein
MVDMSEVRATLPTIWETWAEEDVTKLRLTQLIHLHMAMKKKVCLLEDTIERFKYFDDDEKYTKIFKNKIKSIGVVKKGSTIS